MAQEITECIYCGRHCKLTEPNCERGRELARQIQEGTFDLEAMMKEQETHKRDDGVQGRSSHHHGEHSHGEHSHGEHSHGEHSHRDHFHGDHPHRRHHHHKDHDHHHDKAER